MLELALCKRLPADLTPSPLHTALRAEKGPTPTDLMQSNPTACQFVYPALDARVLGPDTWTYAPDALGSRVARSHLAAYLNSASAGVDVDDVVLTASTSEAYSTLFKVLCDPGARIALGIPGYPLVPHLAALDGVMTTTFRWAPPSSGEGLDWPSVDAALEQGVKALVLVQPSTPLGAQLCADDLVHLSQLCTRAGAVLIIDAVFAPYAADGARAVLPLALRGAGATVVLGGLSKAGGMPQLKLGWMLLYGAPGHKAMLRQGIDWVQDGYLSVSTPIQAALPTLLPHLEPMQQQIRARIAHNYALMQTHLGHIAGLVLHPYRGGWYAVLQGPCDTDEDHLVYHLGRFAQVLVHPGYFYDFEQGGIFVVSLILQSDVFKAALMRMAPVLKSAPWQP